MASPPPTQADAGKVPTVNEDGTGYVLREVSAGGGDAGQPGADGEDGGYYKPSLDSAGNLSWQASKPGMPDVPEANIRGPQGPQGEPGADGKDGEQGPAGAPGADGTTPTIGPNGNWYLGEIDTGKPSRGEQGPQGETGATPQLTIGTVTTLDPGEDATVTITGTAEAPVLNFGIPKGASGSTGLPTPTATDANKMVVVNADGTGYILVDQPVSGIVMTITGNPVNITDSVEWPLLGLKVYGKSTQNGTPSPESPVPIVSAGDGGSILVTVSDGNTQSQQLTAGMPAGGLPGIPVASGGTVTIGGQQYAANIRDYGAGLDTIAVGRIVLDGTEEWIIQSGKFGAFLMEIALPNINMYNKNGLCSHFDYATENNRYNGIYVYNVENVGTIVLGPSLTNQYGSNVETWKTFLQTQSSQGHPVEVLYRLAEPYTQAIPAEELAAYRALHTYDVATVVSTVEDVAGLEVRYVADAQKYIDNRLTAAESHIQEIAAAQLNAQTGG